MFLSCSNRVEVLHAQLAELLHDTPLRDPFQAEVIIVPGNAMARWVNLQLGMAHGVAANIAYPLPAAWIWSLAAAVNAEVDGVVDPLSRDTAAWRLFALLPTLLAEPEFAQLQRYLHDDEQGVKRWQLAQRLADVYDRYQYYRPDWIRAWSEGRSSDSMRSAELAPWQGPLWRALIRDCRTTHRVALIDTLLEALHSPAERVRILALLPERISCFALSSLPPLFVQVLQALSAHLDIFAFQHSPTDQYWADLRSKKALARTRLNNPQEANYYETGNELLASWGRQGQAFQDLLLNEEGLDAVHWEEYFDPGTALLLHRVQRDILALSDQPETVASDHSIEISVCHSAMRECQVLHDRILAALDDNASLRPEDILVMIPEISRYAPYIEAVFRYDEDSGRPFLPWNLSDITIADEHPLIRVFLRLLSLPSSRFTFSELASYLEVPQIAAHFALEGKVQEDVLAMLRLSEVRWGLDAAHKKSLELPETEQNTWAHGIDRLLAGYAMGATQYWEGVAPLEGASGGNAVALGRFCAFLELLKHWHLQLRQPRSMSQWQDALNAMIDALFGVVRDEDDKLQQIRDALDELSEQADGQTLSIELLSLCLEDSLGTRTQHNRFFSGGVSICGMRPMRSLPFKMICVLGMNDAAFPRREQSQSFDGMAAQWRPGDPRKADEDRYLLLETLLCARERLYFSYTGRSLKDNSEQQPSVLLREFLDFLDLHYRLPQDDDAPAHTAAPPMSRCLTTEYPMQPFSARQFGADLPADRLSYDAWWCGIAQRLEDSAHAPALQHMPAWPDQRLAPTEGAFEQLELQRLIRFLQHPSKAFFNTRLGIYLQEEQPSEDEENFTLNGLQTWQMQVDYLARLLAGETQDSAALLSLYEAQGALPHGAMATQAYGQVEEGAASLLERLVPYQGIASTPTAVAVSCAIPHDTLGTSEVVLSGAIGGYRAGVGLLHYSPSKLKPKHQLALWVEHLALCAAGILGTTQHSVLIAKDAERVFEVLAPEAALAMLCDYVALYREGQSRPLPLFPNASFELALDSDEGALRKARKLWAGSEWDRSTPDSRDAYIALAHRGCVDDPIELEEHLRLAQTVYGPLRQMGETP